MSGPYRKPWSNTWFFRRPGYVLFMVREATAVFLLGYLIVLLIFLSKLGSGPEVFAGWLETLQSPGWIAIHVVALIGAAWHSITWFNVTPKAMPMYMGEDRLPDPLVAVAMGYGPWAVITALILWGMCP